MAYTSSSLFCMSYTSVNSHWLYRTTDALAAVDAAGYFSDAGPTSSGKGAPGRGMKVGDLVTVQVVNSITTPTSVTAQSDGVIASINSSTGAGTLLFEVTTAP